MTEIEIQIESSINFVTPIDFVAAHGRYLTCRSIYQFDSMPDFYAQLQIILA